MFSQGGLSQHRGSNPPDMSELHKLLSQALERRGTHVSTSWGASDRSNSFFLDVISNNNGGDPKWRLFNDNSGNRQLLFDYPSCDVLLVHNFIASACAEFARQRVKNNPPDLHATPPPPRFGGDQELPVQSASANASANSTSAFTPAAVPVKPSIAATSQAVAQGDLAKVPVTDLLHSLRTTRATGKLEVRSRQQTALLYVQNGALVDATTPDAEGDDAIIELLTWKEGQYFFEPRVLRNSQTVHQPIESLVEQSKLLSERVRYLLSAGVKPNSILIAKNPNISDADFIKQAADQAPIALEEMARFYRGLNAKSTMEELVRANQQQHTRLQMIAVVHHLVTRGLVGSTNNNIQLDKAASVEPKDIDASAIQSVMMSLRRMETGMFIYPAFLYFLEQEYFRCHRTNTPLSVILFSILVSDGRGGFDSLSTAALLDAVLRISQLKRHVDLLAHYESRDFALLLPNTKSNGALVFAKRIVKTLSEAPLGGEIDPSRLALAFGCASMPEDFPELRHLLGGADLALNRSKSSQKPVVMYRDIKPVTL